MTDQEISTPALDIKLKTTISFPETLHDVLWVVTLSDGTKVWRDDTADIDSWLLLKEYLDCTPSSIFISALHFRFRDHWEEVGRDKDMFFFSKMIKGHYGGSTQFFFCGGYLNDNKETVNIKKYILPELIIMEEEERLITCHTLERGSIWRNNILPIQTSQN